MSTTTPANSNDPVARAIAVAKEPITEFIISLPESKQEFPIPAEDAQTAAAVRDAVTPLYAEAAQADITCSQTGHRLVITLKSKPAGKGGSRR